MKMEKTMGQCHYADALATFALDAWTKRILGKQQRAINDFLAHYLHSPFTRHASEYDGLLRIYNQQPKSLLASIRRTSMLLPRVQHSGVENYQNMRLS